MDVPEVRYVKTPDGAHLAYQVFGDGAFDLVLVPGFASNVEQMWNVEPFARGLRRLGTFSRVIVFDRRGTGLSDRIQHATPPTLEAQMDDVRAVMDATGVERAALFGFELGANLCAVFAAAHPSRVFACVLDVAVARGMRSPDYPWGWTSEQWDSYLEGIDTNWGTQALAEEMARDYYASHASDPGFRRTLASFLRSAASPGAALVFERLLRDTDVRAVLPAIQVPVLVSQRLGNPMIDVGEARYLAANIPGARLLEIDGPDHYPFSGDQEALMTAIERFLAGAHGAEVDFDRVLATVLFTDLVGSTETAARMADRAWKELLASHQRRARSLLARYRGREVVDTGDGFLSVFDGPARAVRCGLAISEDAIAQGLSVRVGVHTGEIELDGHNVRGIAVHIGARIAATAASGEVLVSSTVRDLVAGSGLAFEDRGLQELKGVPGSWHVYAATAPDPGGSSAV